jgi:hypothetical protein
MIVRNDCEPACCTTSSCTRLPKHWASGGFELGIRRANRRAVRAPPRELPAPDAASLLGLLVA